MNNSLEIPSIDDLINENNQPNKKVMQANTEKQSFDLMAKPIIYNPISLLNPVPGSAILQRQRELAFTYLSLLETFGISRSPNWEQECREAEEYIIIYDAKKCLPRIQDLQGLNNKQFSIKFEEFLGERAKFLEEYGETVLKQISNDPQNLCEKDGSLMVTDIHGPYLQELLADVKKLDPEKQLKCRNNLNYLPYEQSQVDAKYSLQGDVVVSNELRQVFQLEEPRQLKPFPFSLGTGQICFGEVLDVLQDDDFAFVLQQNFGISRVKLTPQNQIECSVARTYETYLKQFQNIIKLSVVCDVVNAPVTKLERQEQDFEPLPHEFAFPGAPGRVFNAAASEQKAESQYLDAKAAFKNLYLLKIDSKLAIYNQDTKQTEIDLSPHLEQAKVRYKLQRLLIIAESSVVVYGYTCAIHIDLKALKLTEIVLQLNTITDVLFLNNQVIVCGKVAHESEVTDSVVCVFDADLQPICKFALGARGSDVKAVIFNAENGGFVASLRSFPNLMFLRPEPCQDHFLVAQTLYSQIISVDKFVQAEDYFCGFSRDEAALLLFDNHNIFQPTAINYALFQAKIRDVGVIGAYYLVGTENGLEVLQLENGAFQKLQVFGIQGGVVKIIVCGHQVNIFSQQGALYILSVQNYI